MIQSTAILSNDFLSGKKLQRLWFTFQEIVQIGIIGHIKFQ